LIATPEAVLAFWRAAGRDKWFKKNDAFDAAIREQFLDTQQAAAAGQLAEWQTTPERALALTIVLDQFPRNIFRGSPRAFATDPLARTVAVRALDLGFDRAIAPELRAFFYLPLMHSETLADQERCVGLYEALGDAENLKFAREHADIVRRFGRFPHRNAVLGRATTAEEQAFLDAGGFSG
jgi:uncharacterized protein (DUF924 family)